MEILIYTLILFFGLIFGSFFNGIGNILSNDKKYNYNICSNCNHKISLFHVSLFSYIFNLGKCKYCKKRISLFPVLVELSTASLYLICYLVFMNKEPMLLYLIYSLSFVSSLIIIIVSDIDYMIIPDKVLFLFSFIMIIIKLIIGYYDESYNEIIDIGYNIIFILYEGFIAYFLMCLVKKIGDILLKKDSMGKGDIKLMFYISLVIGWKLSVVTLFLASFIALPFAIINMLKKDKLMLPFGPFIAVSALILFLTQIDFNTLIDYLK